MNKDAEKSTAAQYDFKKSLLSKAMILLGATFFTGIIVYLIHRYFYILDSYVYTGEFHLLFIKNNIHATKIDHLSEYLQPMSFLLALPVFLTGICYAGLDPSASERVLLHAATKAFGTPESFLLGVLGFFLLGLFSYGVGWFFFGDILPVFLKENYSGYQKEIKKPALIAIPLAFALPYVPIVLTAGVGGIGKVSWSRMLQLLLVGSIIRTFAEMLM
jgi:uncharacterized membrane protein YdjX (TVP38/TMEM64 family)